MNDLNNNKVNNNTDFSDTRAKGASSSAKTGDLVCNEVLARRPRRRLRSNRKGKVSRNEKGRRKWEKLDYEVAIECRIRAGENYGVKRGLGKKVHIYWMEKNMFEITEKNLMNRIRAIMTKG